VSEGRQSPEHDSAGAPKRSPNERRDVQRTINLWQRHVSPDDGAPLLTSFDFSAMKGDWGNRFLICSDRAVDNAAFVMYGINFAQLLDLPHKLTAIAPLMQQIPERYRPIFANGCTKALTEPAPAQFSGSFSFEFKNELYRAVFLPIRIHPNWSKRLIFGSFNYTMVLAVDKKATEKWQADTKPGSGRH
jgi:hypothetical protein